MLAAFLLILPVGLASAVSPVLLTEQTLLLAGANGLRAARLFAAGAIAVLIIFVGALHVLGNAISLPAEPKLNSTLDLVIGLGLLAAAAAVHWAGKRHSAPPPPEHQAGPARDSRRARAAFPFGVFSMATNFTSLALVAVGAKQITGSNLDAIEGALLALMLIALASAPTWVPIALTWVAPGPGQRALAALGDLIDRRGRAATVVLLAAGGLFFAVRGLIELIG